MKRSTVVLPLVLFLAISAFSQNKPKKQADIQNQINNAKEKNLVIESNSKFTRVRGARLVLGTQALTPDGDFSTASVTVEASGDVARANFTAKIPTWEFIPYFGFLSDTLTSDIQDFYLMFYVYNEKFQLDSDLVIEAGNDDLQYKSIEKGRSLTSVYQAVEGVNAKDRTSDDQRNNAGNISRNAKPYYTTFKIPRADFEKLVKAEKVKIVLSKQYQVSLRKEYKTTLQTMLYIATLEK